jgi:hypothetical protein
MALTQAGHLTQARPDCRSLMPRKTCCANDADVLNFRRHRRVCSRHRFPITLRTRQICFLPLAVISFRGVLQWINLTNAMSDPIAVISLPTGLISLKLFLPRTTSYSARPYVPYRHFLILPLWGP